MLSIASMKNLLDRTLDLARFDAGVHSLRKEVFDLRVLLGQLHREALQVFKPSGIELLWDMGAMRTVGAAASNTQTREVSAGAASQLQGSASDAGTERSGASETSGSAAFQTISAGAGSHADSAGVSTVGSVRSTGALWVRGDPLQLRQSMMNILHNASKYTPAGQNVFVSLSLEVKQRHAVILEEHEEPAPEHDAGLAELGLTDQGTVKVDEPMAAWYTRWAGCCKRSGGKRCLGGSRVGIAGGSTGQELQSGSPFEHNVSTTTAEQDANDNPLGRQSSTATYGGITESKSTDEVAHASPHVQPQLDIESRSTSVNLSRQSSVPAGSDTRGSLGSADMDTSDLNFKLAGTAVLVMSVRDTGRGMTLAEQRGIFTPFSRLHSAQEGTGLGLNIARKAMQAHGGDVTVHSDGLGKGCTFTVRAELRLKRAVRKRTRQQQRDGSPSAHVINLRQSHRAPASPLRITSGRSIDSNNIPTAEGSLAGSEAVGGSPAAEVGASAEPSASFGPRRGDPTPPASDLSHGTHAPRPPHPHVAQVAAAAMVDDTLVPSHSMRMGSAASSTAPPGGGKRGAPQQYEGVVVLVVDDDTATRRVMSRLIKRLMPGCSVLTAPDGGAAVRVVKQAAVPPAYITMDNQMPVMTGQEAAQALRAWGYSGRIVGVTGNAVGDDGDAFRAAGVDAVVFKPSTAAKLAVGLQLQA